MKFKTKSAYVLSVALVSILLLLIYLVSNQADTLKPEINGIITIGDSLTAGLIDDGQGNTFCAAQSYRQVEQHLKAGCRGDGLEGVGGWQPELKKLAKTPVYDFGNSGETTEQILARLPSVLQSTQASHLIIWAGTNDTIHGTIGGAIKNLKKMISLAHSSGRIVVIATVPPLTNSRHARAHPKVRQLNAHIRKLAHRSEGVILVDLFSKLDPDWAKLNSGDFIHLNTKGNKIVAREIWNAL